MTIQKPLALLIYRGYAGDRNARGVGGAQLVGEEMAKLTGAAPTYVGTPREPLRLPWDRELAAARIDLRTLASACAGLLDEGKRLAMAMGRCAAGLATIPVIAARRPDACVIWFDAHGDSNVPTSRAEPYLGGMVITGAAGLWKSGLGGGLDLSNVLLVGARDLDPDEARLIEEGKLQHLTLGPDLPARLRSAIAGRPVYVHLDCDVMDPGIVPTEYAVKGGLTLDDLRAAMEVIAEHEIIGIEVTEFEEKFADGRPGSAAGLVKALEATLNPS
jgi:arginase